MFDARYIDIGFSIDFLHASFWAPNGTKHRAVLCMNVLCDQTTGSHHFEIENLACSIIVLMIACRPLVLP
jgi:hypothetical protein